MTLDKNCGFFTNGQFLSVSGFSYSDLTLLYCVNVTSKLYAFWAIIETLKSTKNGIFFTLYIIVKAEHKMNGQREMKEKYLSMYNNKKGLKFLLGVN